MQKGFERTKVGICHGGSRGRTFAAVLPKNKKKEERRKRRKRRRKGEEEEERVISAGSTLRINCTISSIQE